MDFMTRAVLGNCQAADQLYLVRDAASYRLELGTLKAWIAGFEAMAGNLQALLRVVDSVVVEYVDAATVRLKAGGVCVADDLHEIYVLANDLQVVLPVDLDSGSEQANVLYYLYIGRDAVSGGNLRAKFSLNSGGTTGLYHAHCIRFAVPNDGASNLIPFVISGRSLRYLTPCQCAGSDTTELFDAFIGALAWGTAVTFEKFAPVWSQPYVRGIGYNGTTTYLKWRPNGHPTFAEDWGKGTYPNTLAEFAVPNQAIQFGDCSGQPSAIRVSVTRYEV